MQHATCYMCPRGMADCRSHISKRNTQYAALALVHCLWGGAGWRAGSKGRDVVTNRIFLRFFFEKGVTLVVTGRDQAAKVDKAERHIHVVVWRYEGAAKVDVKPQAA